MSNNSVSLIRRTWLRLITQTGVVTVTKSESAYLGAIGAAHALSTEISALRRSLPRLQADVAKAREVLIQAEVKQREVFERIEQCQALRRAATEILGQKELGAKPCPQLTE
jgi:hypothetical protein